MGYAKVKDLCPAHLLYLLRLESWTMNYEKHKQILVLKTKSYTHMYMHAHIHRYVILLVVSLYVVMIKMGFFSL